MELTRKSALSRIDILYFRDLIINFQFRRNKACSLDTLLKYKLRVVAFLILFVALLCTITVGLIPLYLSKRSIRQSNPESIFIKF